MAPSSSRSPFPSKKLLIIDPKPKSCPPAAHPTCATSSSTIATLPERRTRDQPNLSDCHRCGRRVNHADPKDRLQLMDSIWRIVLLCRKCLKDIHSGQTCPYCFQETGNSSDPFQCGLCDRKIHEDCVLDYGNCSPWSYLGVRPEGFRVCVDCWVPELLKKSFRVSGRSGDKGELKDEGEAKDLSEKGLKDVKRKVGKKAKMVANAKEQASKKAKLVKNPVDLVNVVLALEAPNYKDSVKIQNLNSAAVEVVDDAEVAIQLHRAMNSSPRISRSKCSVNSSSLDVLNIRDQNNSLDKRSDLGKNHGEAHKLGTCTKDAGNERIDQPRENGPCNGVDGLNLGLLPYKRDRMRKIWQLTNENAVVSESRFSQPAEVKFNLHLDDASTRGPMRGGADISEASFYVNADQSNLCTDVDSYGQELGNGQVRVSGECSSYDNNTVAFKSKHCQSDDARLRTGFLVKGDTKVIFPSGSCDADQDCYHLDKRATGMGTQSDSTFHSCGMFGSENQACAPAMVNSEADCPEKCDEELILPNGTSNWDSDHYGFKYAKRIKGSKSSSLYETKWHSDSSE